MKHIQNKPKALIIVVACLLPPFTLLMFMILADEWRTQMELSAGFRKDCKTTHMTGGFVRKSMSLAEMSAITTWMREVEAYGKDYSLWSNASRKMMKCKKIRGTEYINCIARASPCKLIHLNPDPKMMVQKKSEKPVTQ